MSYKAKSTIYALTFILGLTLASSASAAITIRPALNLGLVSYWAMDEGYGTAVNDQSGSGNTGTLTQMDPATVWVDGKLGKALDFDGSNDYVEKTNPSNLNITGQITIAAWVYPQAWDNTYENNILTKAGDGDYGVWNLHYKTTTNGFRFEINNGSSQTLFEVTPSTALNTWYHVVGTYDGSNMRLYINGVQSNYKAVSGAIATNTAPLRIGKQFWWSSNYSLWNGYIDEARVYNRALSAGEVTRLYNLTKPKIKVTSDNGLVGYWSFDEGLGTIAGDMSGNGKNGTITGASWTTGKRSQALYFNGTSDYVDAGNVNSSVKTVSFWLKADTTTNRVVDFNGTAKVELSSGTITTSGITSPTIYVDGAVSSTVDTNWHYVTIKTDTGINASALKLGQGDAWACGDTLTYCGDNYTTVQMTSTYGSQCWLGENLRNTTKPDCTTGITSYCHGSGCGSPWGRLYDWNTSMNGATTATGCGAKIQGICPAGWHIPSGYLGCSTDDFPTLGADGGALKKVNTSSGVPWDEPNTGATNASNWTGYPAGFWVGSCVFRGTTGWFWSSAENGGSAWLYSLSNSDGSWSLATGGKSYGSSLRCVNDVPTNHYFSGKLDEVRMYNRALSATEITNLYTSSKKIIKVNAPQNNKITNGLVGMWTFNGQDVSGNIAFDRSGSGKNGTITGATLDSGKVGQAISFNGTSNSINLGNVYNGVKSVTFWTKTADTNDNGYFAGLLDEVRFYSTTLSSADVKRLYNLGASGTALPMSSVQPNTKIIDLNGTAGIKAVSGTITASGFTTPTIYVDAAVATTIDDNWRFVAITSGTGINASASTLALGYVWACGDTLTYCGVNYATVQMTSTYGSQCWLQENLRNTTKPDCTTGITSFCHGSGCGSPWGRLYDWDTMMNGATTATGCGAKIQGICPSGWHIPSDYASCSGDDFEALGAAASSTVGGALKQAGTANWNSPNTGATNASNWTGYPAGQWDSEESNFYNRAYIGSFWSSAEDGDNPAWAWERNLDYDGAAWGRYYDVKVFGYSLRCVKD